MTNIEARRKLQEIIITSNLSEYFIGINIINCNLEEIKQIKRTIAKKYHPDLNPNLKEKDIDTYKTINGLIAIILKNDNINNNQNERKNPNYTNRNYDTLKEEFKISVINKTSKYKAYGDYIILKTKIELLINNFINRRIQLNNYNTSTIQYELFNKIDNIFYEHYKKKLYDSIYQVLKTSDYYNKLKKYIDNEVSKSLKELINYQYNNYEYIETKLTNNIIEKTAYLKALTEKCKDLRNKLNSAPDNIKRKIKYQNILSELLNILKNEIEIDRLKEIIEKVSSLSNEYDILQKEKTSEKTSYNKESHIYIPRHFITSGDFNDGIKYLDESREGLKLIDIGRVSIHILLSTKKISRSDLYRDYYLLEDYLQSCKYVGKTVVFPKFGMTIRDYLENNIYDYATLLYQKEKDNLGLYVKEDNGNKIFYFSKLSNKQVFSEDSKGKDLAKRYQDKEILINDIEEYAKRHIRKMQSEYSFISINNINKNNNFINKEKYNNENIDNIIHK